MAQDAHQMFKKGFENVEGVSKLTDEQLKKLQKLLLVMLQDFIYVADKYGFNYSLGGGSVLGAVRHGGFIPWDDDIDINMPRIDYLKFEKVFNEELGDKYILCAPSIGNNHGMSSVQIKKKGTVYKSFNELSKTDDQCGIYIDIFVIENVFDNKILRTIQGVLSLGFGYLLTCRKTLHDLPSLRPYITKNRELEKAFDIKARLGYVTGMIKLDTMAKLTDKIYSLCKNNKSKKVTFPSGRKHFFGEMTDRDELTIYTKVMFDGVLVNIPKEFDSYMKRLYGKNYMELPPVSAREQHPLMKLDFGEKNNE